MRKKSYDDIYNFYCGNGRDMYGRTFEEIISKSNVWMEFNHTFIQRLFPLDEPSGADETAPVLTEELVKKMRMNPKAIQRMKKAFTRMMKLYGFQVIYGMADNKIENVISHRKWHYWITFNNHNYKRISRILKSLRLMGLNEEAEKFFVVLENLYNSYSFEIGKKAYSYWCAAGAKQNSVLLKEEKYANSK